MTTLRHPARRPSSGITLVEILISIMILGIGLVSLATLFPIGLLRLREAQRQSRSAILLESAGADLATRGLFTPASFTNPAISPWYYSLVGGVTNNYFDPWIQDTPLLGADWAGNGNVNNIGAYSGLGGLGVAPHTQFAIWGNLAPPIPGPGLPVAYDPLWRWKTGIAPNDPTIEARFGAGVGPLAVAGADGLQRLTNLQSSAANTASILQAFVSPEDVVWQEQTGSGYLDLSDPTLAFSKMPVVANPSPVVPDLTEVIQQAGALPASNNITIPDWRYTWMFTGQRTDTFAGTVYDGSIVVFENRPFGVDSVTLAGVSGIQVAGEPVVLAVFGYSGLNGNSIWVGTMSDTTVVYYGASNSTVLLYWPVGIPDPLITPGSWIADVTYERQQQLDLAKFQFGGTLGSGGPPAQRCYWYQVSRVTTPADLAGSPYSAIGAGRYMFVSTSTPLKAKTLLYINGKQTVPYHVNAALVSPHVVNVIPRTFVMQ